MLLNNSVERVRTRQRVVALCLSLSATLALAPKATASTVEHLPPARAEASHLLSPAATKVRIQPNVTVTGELKKWHPITILLEGPQVSEDSNPNPFLDYRFEVVFSLAELSITVPGYFAADGNAHETSATSGNIWKAHFVPPQTGNWTFRTAFRQGTDVALSTDPNAGQTTEYDNIFGSVTISDSDKVGADFRGKGKLRYAGEHYLRFDNGEYFIKGGTDSPENLLAYEDFDGTYNDAGTNFIKSYANHVQDWQPGDPTWQGGKGKGLIGALNYLAGKGMNSVYFITMNVEGDGKDVWPWTSPTQRSRFDVSKLEQWDVVFSHMDKLGLMLHIVTQETENELLLNNGDLGRQRKLYYRELIARFGHHLAITWNLGEENDQNTTAQRKDFADYFDALDPYGHPVVLHTFPGKYDQIYGPLLDHPTFDGPSLQVSTADKTHDITRDWVEQSASNGTPWYVCIDEAGPWQDGVTPDGSGNNHDTVRKEVLWGNLMAGGGGVEWYFGFNHPNNDLNAEDWRTRDNVWNFTRHALDFFYDFLPFTEMTAADNLSSNGQSYVFAKNGDTYAVYLKNGGTTSLDLEASNKTYAVSWFNPRTGGSLQSGTVAEVTGPGTVSIGEPPTEKGKDWAALVRVKQGEVFGDASLDGTLSSLDASLSIRHGISLIVLPAEAQSLADVSGNGAVGAFDASLILQRIVGNISCFPVESGCSSSKRAPIVEERDVVWDETSWDRKTRLLRLPLRVHAHSLQSLEADLRFDASRMRFVRFEAGDADDWLVAHRADEGSISVALAGTPTAIDGTLFTLVFETGDPADAKSLVGTFIADQEPLRILDSPAADVPHRTQLHDNYPNPFNPSTTIRFMLADDGQALVEVFDLTGRNVATLLDASLPAGEHLVSFDAGHLPSGVYLYRLTTTNGLITKKMMLVR